MKAVSFCPMLFVSVEGQGWHSGESTGFDTGHVEFLEFLKEPGSSGDEDEFVGSSLCTEKFFPSTSTFPAI